MALLRLDDEAADRLVALPESGMGYQVVRYGDSPFVVFNATLAIPFLELKDFVFSRAATEGENEEEPIDGWSQETKRWPGRIELLYSPLLPQYRSNTLGLSFPESIVKVTPRTYKHPPAAYFRFSAFPKDKRIDANGGFVPGTYATTFADMKAVPSGFAAVGRYALPKANSARYVHCVVTYDDPTYMGTVTPNYGQAGGGVEVVFGSGASHAKTASFPIDIG